MQVGAGGAVEEDTARACGRWQCLRTAAGGRACTARRRARVPPAGARTAAGGRGRIVRQQHQVAAVRECRKVLV